MSLVKDYFEKLVEYKKEYGDRTIVLMQVGAFYEVYGNDEILDIYDFAEKCELAVANHKMEKVKMAGFRDYMLEKYLRKLQQNAYTVVVFTQDEQKSGTTRSLMGIYSPGTYYQENTNVISNNTICIWLYTSFSMKQKKEMIYIGLSAIDIYTGKVSIYQTEEKLVYIPTTFNEIERWMSIYNPSELIIVSTLKKDEINKIIQMSNIKTRMIHIENNDEIKIKNCEKQVYQKCILEKFYGKKGEIIYDKLSENVIGLQSVCYLLNFMNDHNPNLTKELNEPLIENNEKKMILANYSLKQLNILETGEDNGLYSSLLKMIVNECSSTMGKREIENILLNPITEIEKLKESYSIIERIIEYGNEKNVEEILKKCKDLEKIIRQLIMGKINIKELYWIYEEYKRCEILDRYCSGLFELDKEKIKDFINFFENKFIIEPEDEIYLRKICEKTSKLHEEMKENKECMKYIVKEMEKYENYFNQNDKKKKGEYFRLSENPGSYIISTDRRCKIIQDIMKKEGLRVYKLNSTESYIESDILKEKYEKIIEIKERRKRIMEEKYLEYLEIIKKEYLTNIQYICNYLTKLDVYYTKTKIAKKYGYCKPEIENSENSFIRCKNLRHPLIENICQSSIYVSNDISLSSEGILLYGTNAVGKTSFIKSIGIGIIMAQSGFYVPAEEFIYNPYKSIFTRIIGNDNLFKGLSTFAVEMSELRTILQMSDSNSLILGDELCSGTEIMSAISIFVAGIEDLVMKKASFIFATHLHEIINYDEIVSLKEKLKIKHMSVIYNKEKDELIYDRKIKDGSGTKMYGLEVCKAMHLPDSFLEKANKIRLKYHANDEKVGILELKPSQYNAKLLSGLLCEICGKKRGEEIHHLIQQKEANKEGIIKKKDKVFHKNHLSNLINICSECHKLEHSSTK